MSPKRQRIRSRRRHQSDLPEGKQTLASVKRSAQAYCSKGSSAVASFSGGSSATAMPAIPLSRKRALAQRTHGQEKGIPVSGSKKRVVPVCPGGFTLPPAGPDFYLPPGFGFREVSESPPPSPQRESHKTAKLVSPSQRESHKTAKLVSPSQRESHKTAKLVSPLPRKLQETVELQPWERLNMPMFQRGSREYAQAPWNQDLLDEANQLENADEELCDTEEAKVAFRAFKAKFASVYREMASTDTMRVLSNVPCPRDTQEEHLTAEEMELKADSSGWLLYPQARHFAMLALEHYNSSKKHKFELGRVLLSKCFSEVDGTTYGYGHVNFTAIPKHLPMTKRLFFAELMLIPDLQACEDAEPMRVLHVCTIDHSCFEGCHELEREIKKPVRKNMDYDRCHACSDRIKHPSGDQFIGGHDRTRMSYFSVLA